VSSSFSLVFQDSFVIYLRFFPLPVSFPVVSSIFPPVVSFTPKVPSQTQRPLTSHTLRHEMRPSFPRYSGTMHDSASVEVGDSCCVCFSISLNLSSESRSSAHHLLDHREGDDDLFLSFCVAFVPFFWLIPLLLQSKGIRKESERSYVLDINLLRRGRRRGRNASSSDCTVACLSIL
jgi:hypothetical protein